MLVEIILLVGEASDGGGGSEGDRGEDNGGAGGDSSDHRVDGDVTEVKKCDVIMGC